ncbi:DNA-binding response regulator [Sphingobium lactosutens]|uniref:LuxR C-terminal-related transcriptional regulator n=1 Tax=Sphingobium lactosutens TaxID=522773 RepID=UPI0015BEE53C|nr:response regulator transcription factor [Sphingobium lactosutens]NWK97808.1 DNA-binding response regulator [Sphingobium lactosutens]
MLDTQVHLAIVGKNEIIREGLRRILIDEDFLIDDAVSRPLDLDGEMDGDTVIVVDAIDINDGLATCEEVRARFPSSRIVIMADEYGLEDVSRAFMTGAVDGYIVKQISCRPLASALRLTALGEKVLPSQIAESLGKSQFSSLPNHWSTGAIGNSLSTREVDILRCLVEGEPNKVISRRLQIADATVKVHIKAILRKLRVRNRTQAAIWAVSRGMAGDASDMASIAPVMGSARPAANLKLAMAN